MYTINHGTLKIEKLNWNRCIRSNVICISSPALMNMKKMLLIYCFGNNDENN